MPNVIDDYYNLIQQPWGRMFYDILFAQMNPPSIPRLKILDFGSGFGVTSNHYAANHELTAIEPNPKMSDKRIASNEYTFIAGGFERLSDFSEYRNIAFFNHLLFSKK